MTSFKRYNKDFIFSIKKSVPDIPEVNDYLENIIEDIYNELIKINRNRNRKYARDVKNVRNKDTVYVKSNSNKTWRKDKKHEISYFLICLKKKNLRKN